MKLRHNHHHQKNKRNKKQKKHPEIYSTFTDRKLSENHYLVWMVHMIFEWHSWFHEIPGDHEQSKVNNQCTYSLWYTLSSKTSSAGIKKKFWMSKAKFLYVKCEWLNIFIRRTFRNNFAKEYNCLVQFRLRNIFCRLLGIISLG